MKLDKFPDLVFATSQVKDGGMGFYTTNISEVLENRKKFFKTLGITLDQIVTLHQQHGDKIIRVTKEHAGNDAYEKKHTLKADCMITNEKNLFLTVLAADCNQIALFDFQNTALGLIHAGRKGLELHIVEKAIAAMVKKFSTKPKDLLVNFGPSIGPCHYEKDIWHEAENQLKDSGVLGKNIYNPKICTYESSIYFSHRRAAEKGDNDYRFMTICGIRPHTLV